ncbi:MAG TPA: hypothetical protein VK149_05585 [Sideroxyarcus sp.]|nr:hypothetical protein [Sideroxyarcus sp.]
MKKHPSHLSYLAAAMLAAYAVAGYAAAPTSGAYITDKTNQYVEDETSQVLAKVNGVLCHVDAMAPAKLPNATYIALIDSNVCNANGNAGNNNGGNNGGTAGGGGGNNNNNNGAASYTKAVVETTQATGEALLANVWLDADQGNKIQAHLSALQAPTDTLPYGEFRLDYCGTTASATSNCDREKGYISAGPGGLMYYSFMKEDEKTQGTPAVVIATTKTIDSVAINAAGVDSGTGAVTSQARRVIAATGAATLTTTSTSFAYDAAHFIRSGDTGVTYKCFDRSLANADKTAWTYGLYEEATGGHYNRLTGFPIDFTDAGGVKHNGYMGYWGFWSDYYGTDWMPIYPTNGSTINGYVNNASSATQYTFNQTGGKLIKHVRAGKKLDSLDKVRFYYYSPAYMPVNCTPTTGTNPAATLPAVPCSLDQYVQYEIYWDAAAQQFMAATEQDPTKGYAMVPLSTPLPISNADMALNNTWGIWAWSSMTGGSFNIDANEIAKLTAANPGANVYAKFISDDIVYPADFATVLPNGLKCIGDCPTRALVDAYIANPTTSPYANAGMGFYPTWVWDAVNSVWTYQTNGVPRTSLVSYTLDNGTGNLIDATSAQVINTSLTSLPWSSSGFSSGRMYSADDQLLLDEAKGCGVATACANTVTYANADLDLQVPGSGATQFTFYTWETSDYPWSKLTFLKDGGGNVVRFEPPLNVNFTVPANTDTVNKKPFGDFAGASVTLTYNGFGSLWGFPYVCIDLSTNLACDWASYASADMNKWVWKPAFSIPHNGGDNFVTGTRTPGAAMENFWVRSLDEEVRFVKVADTSVAVDTVCNNLSLPAVSPQLPQATGFKDPTLYGTKENAETRVVNTAPRVIHGVVQY